MISEMTTLERIDKMLTGPFLNSRFVLGYDTLMIDVIRLMIGTEPANPMYDVYGMIAAKRARFLCDGVISEACEMVERHTGAVARRILSEIRED